MKATELRIGNLAIDTTEGFAGRKNRTIEVSHEVIYSIACGNDYWKPVPLTEEWLERFGFELPAHSWIGDKFHLSEYGKGSKHQNGGVWVVAMNKNNAIIAEIQYVHQLQNLYFALTGQELTIKE